MNEWQYYEPIGGWVAFDMSDAFVEALWAQLTQFDWHYLSMTSDHSFWESKQDASGVQVIYDGSKVAGYAVQAGLAYNQVEPIISKFRLAAVPLDK